MALPSSGQLSLNDIAAEFGGTTPHALSEYYGAAPGIPGSGTISIGDFYGASNQLLTSWQVAAQRLGTVYDSGSDQRRWPINCSGIPLPGSGQKRIIVYARASMGGSDHNSNFYTPRIGQGLNAEYNFSTNMNVSTQYHSEWELFGTSPLDNNVVFIGWLEQNTWTDFTCQAGTSNATFFTNSGAVFALYIPSSVNVSLSSVGNGTSPFNTGNFLDPISVTSATGSSVERFVVAPVVTQFTNSSTGSQRNITPNGGALLTQYDGGVGTRQYAMGVGHFLPGQTDSWSVDVAGTSAVTFKQVWGSFALTLS